MRSAPTVAKAAPAPAVAVAAASMRIDGSLAQLTGAATLPAFRRRGLQTALTLHRLADARAAFFRTVENGPLIDPTRGFTSSSDCTGSIAV